MAWSMGKAGLGLPTEETPTDVPQWEVDEAMQDPFAADGFTNASASGSGGTGGAPVVVIADPPQDRPGKKRRCTKKTSQDKYDPDSKDKDDDRDDKADNDE